MTSTPQLGAAPVPAVPQPCRSVAAAEADTPGQTRADEVVGTALYMAPEQVAEQTISPATDVYALGAVAYHCLAGRPLFNGDNPVTSP